MSQLYVGKMGFKQALAITSLMASEFGNQLRTAGLIGELDKGPKNSIITSFYSTLLRTAMLTEQASHNLLDIEGIIDTMEDERKHAPLSAEEVFILESFAKAVKTASEKCEEAMKALDERLFNDDDEETSSMGTLDSEEDDIASVVDTVGVAATEEDIADFPPELRSLLETLRSSGQEVKIRKITVKS